MTESLTRPVPTPSDVAPPPARPVPTPASLGRGRPGPAAVAAAMRSYDRHRWEEALIAAGLPHHNAVMLGWSLAHAANSAGYLPSSITGPANLGRRSQLNKHQVQFSITQLERAGLIRRPDPHTWPDKTLPRPITLTVPGGQSSPEPPPSTGGAHV